MLHTLWMILKIILLTAGILLGLLVLLLALILFCPVRYRAEGQCREQDIHGKIRLSWLLHTVSVTAVHDGQDIQAVLRVLGIPLESYQRFFRRIRRFLHTKRRKPKPPEDLSKTADKMPRKPLEPAFYERTDEAAEERHESPPTGKRIEIVRRIVRRIFRRFLRMVRMILGIPGRIAAFFRKIALTIRRFCGKIEQWKTFLEDERTGAGIALGWGELKRLLRHASPRRIQGRLLFGLSNPAATGEVLALIGATCPLHKNALEVMPVFDRQVLDAEVLAKGRVYLIVLLAAGLRLYFDKNIKYMIKVINKEG